MSAMDGAWATFFQSFQGDLDRDMEYGRMQSHASFMQNLKRLDSSSGYATKDGREISWREYESLPEDQKGNLQSKASLDYQQRIDAAKEIAQINTQSLLDAEEGKMALAAQNEDQIINRAKKTAIAQAEGTLEVNKMVADQQRATVAEDYNKFMSSPVYQKLPENSKMTLEIFQAAGVPLTTGLTSALKEDKEQKPVDPATLKIATEQLAMNPMYVGYLKDAPDKAWSMANRTARIMEGSVDPNQTTAFTNQIMTAIQDAAMSGDPKKYWETMKIEAPDVYGTISMVFGNAMPDEKPSKQKEKEAERNFTTFANPKYLDKSGRGAARQAAAARAADSPRSRPIWKPSTRTPGQQINAIGGGSLLESGGSQDTADDDLEGFRKAGTLLGN